MTIKIAWSNYNKFPNNTFFWRGLDGSELLCHFPPSNEYCSNGDISSIENTIKNFKDKGRSDDSMYLFGDGDGGGGPQPIHIERLTRLQDLQGVPNVKFSTFDNFFESVRNNSKKLMTWEGELYLEAHNGTYTSMAEHKNYNRSMESLLRDTEILSSFALLHSG